MGPKRGEGGREKEQLSLVSAAEKKREEASRNTTKARGKEKGYFFSLPRFMAFGALLSPCTVEHKRGGETKALGI